MLVKKGVLNVGTLFTGTFTGGRSKGQYIKIRLPSKFTDKLNWLEPAQRKCDYFMSFHLV